MHLSRSGQCLQTNNQPEDRLTAFLLDVGMDVLKAGTIKMNNPLLDRDSDKSLGNEIEHHRSR
jgi:hypothetical protein